MGSSRERHIAAIVRALSCKETITDYADMRQKAARRILMELHSEGFCADDPEADDTPFSHPAYDRGCSAGMQGAVWRIQEALDGLDSGAGTLGDPALEALRRRVIRLRPAAPLPKAKR